jgi:hypothetical protein
VGKVTLNSGGAIVITLKFSKIEPHEIERVVSKLSWGAIGILLYLHSKPEGATLEEIYEASTNARYEVDEFIQELLQSEVLLR